MKVRINPQAITNPHIKHAFNQAGVMGIIGTVTFVKGENIGVRFDHNDQGDAKKQSFPMHISWVNVAE